MITNPNVLQRTTFFTDLGQLTFSEVRSNGKVENMVTHITTQGKGVTLISGVDLNAHSYLTMIAETDISLGRYKKQSLKSWINRF